MGIVFPFTTEGYEAAKQWLLENRMWHRLQLGRRDHWTLIQTANHLYRTHQQGATNGDLYVPSGAMA